MDPLIVILIIAVIFLLLIKGVIRTFQRNAIAAILLIIFLFPVFLIWAFIDLFLEKPKKPTKVIIIVEKLED